jgi:glycolate oxidase FAD binding subunit
VQRKEEFMFTEEKKNSQIFQDSNHLVPKSEAEVSDIIKEAYKKKLPIEICGSNSKKFIGYNVQTAKTLNLSNINGVLEYLPEELYIKVKPGTPLKEVEETLEKNNQELAFEPTDFGFIYDGKSNKGTVGGCIACNFAGSRRFKSGSVRDFVLGFRGVNGKGDVIKSGGTVVKNVTGYDLSKLVSGSFGTLVALTEITLKVSPKKTSQNTIIIYEKDPKKISLLFDQVLSSSNEISGAVFVPDEPVNKKFDQNKKNVFKFNDLDQEGPFFALRIEGDQKSTKERIKDITNEMNLKKYKTSLLDVYQSIPFWKKINSLELFTGTKNNILRAVVPPSKCEMIIRNLKNKYKYFIDWSGSLFWIEVCDKDNEAIKELKSMILANDGYLTIIKKSENFEYSENIFTINDVKLMISKKIKESFDPKGLFNPGKMYKDF